MAHLVRGESIRKHRAGKERAGIIAGAGELKSDPAGRGSTLPWYKELPRYINLFAPHARKWEPCPRDGAVKMTLAIKSCHIGLFGV